MNEELVVHLKNPQTWKRFAFMFLFVVIFYVVAHLIVLVVFFQALLTLITGDRNERVSQFGSQLIAYIHDILGYLTYRHDDAPFPFSDWPQGAPVEPAPGDDAGDGKDASGKPGA
ncbi:MAG: DUF4389 domain-containing protein [Gammaproteobacteria bacterium]|nr:DUF4389 domain-containing protein [Gammaproteobacteria bacterium]